MLLYSGGMPRASYGDRHCLTLQQDRRHVTLDFTSRVIDFFTVHCEDQDKGESHAHTHTAGTHTHTEGLRRLRGVRLLIRGLPVGFPVPKDMSLGKALHPACLEGNVPVLIVSRSG